ncbi:MAG: helix-turn-helix domain-containing protein [Gemmatimonadaceae bacterium]|nr:helix-turn-helix domain-containing protein [Gemmatimonadaceae bacterium]
MPAPLAVAVLVVPSVVPFDLGVPAQVFGYPRPDLGVQRYTLTVCADTPGPIPTSTGFSILVEHGLRALQRAHTIVVPGVDDLETPFPPAALRALRRAWDRGTRIVSICSGAFVLAEAGLLAGRRATTHWMDVPEFRRRFPGTTCDPNVLYVDDGQVLTSAGIASGIDLCLHVVRADYGAVVANAVARRMVVAPHRSGGQAQFAQRPMGPETLPRPLDATRRWMLEHLHEPITLEQMAARAGQSVRTFSRHFASESATSPVRWLLTQRLAAARQWLEESDERIEDVARRCGFGTAINMRVHFSRALRTSPGAYRRAFRLRNSGGDRACDR